MWTHDSDLLSDLARKMSKRFNHLADMCEQPKTLEVIVSTFFQLLWIPGGVGLLGIMLAFEKTEPWSLRLLGVAAAIAMLPFMILTMIGLLVSEGIEKIRNSITK